jgi:hypothetical protein
MLSTAALRREAVRAACAFGLYLLLERIWTRLGVQGLYERAVGATADSIFSLIRHFPFEPQHGALSVRYFDGLILLSVSYAVVSIGLPWRVRVRRGAALALSVFFVHATAAALQTEVQAVRELWAAQHVMLLLPREMQVAIWLKYALFEGGLQLAPFLLVALWVRWNTMVATDPATGFRRRRLLAAAAIAALVLCSLGGWGVIRERDQRHSDTHRWFGERLLREERWSDAETQFEASLVGRSDDGRAWYGLAVARRNRGLVTASIATLQQALEAVHDPAWRSRIESTAQRWLADAAAPQI